MSNLDNFTNTCMNLSRAYEIVLNEAIETKQIEIELKEQIYTLNTIIDDYHSREMLLKEKLNEYEIKFRSFAKENKNFIKKIQSVENRSKSFLP